MVGERGPARWGEATAEPRTRPGRTLLRLEPRYQPGLLGLQQWSHLWVIYWFDQNDTPAQRATLGVHPRGNPQKPLTGVFTSRSPWRPDLVASSLSRVVAIKENVIEIGGIDALDQTPVVDIKPYIPGGDTPVERVTVPDWAGREFCRVARGLKGPDCASYGWRAPQR